MHDALAPYSDVLNQLLSDPETVDTTKVPVKHWLASKHKSLEKTIIPYVGNLSLMDRARIANWFEVHISKDP